jgi:hypothetical protein
VLAAVAAAAAVAVKIAFDCVAVHCAHRCVAAAVVVAAALLLLQQQCEHAVQRCACSEPAHCGTSITATAYKAQREFIDRILHASADSIYSNKVCLCTAMPPASCEFV